MHMNFISDDCATADSTASLVQGRSKDGEKDYRGNDGFESKEVLHLCVRNAEERQLQQEVQEKRDEARGRQALAFGYVVWDVLETGPDSCEKNSHALSTSDSLDTRV